MEDLSNNGTFVDGLLVGKNKKLPLVNNAVLSLAEQRNRGDTPVQPEPSAACRGAAHPDPVLPLCSVCFH